MTVEAICRFCGQVATFEAEALKDGYPHRRNGAGELEPMACTNTTTIQVRDTSRLPESIYLPTPVAPRTVVCRENVKDVFPHHQE